MHGFQKTKKEKKIEQNSAILLNSTVDHEYQNTAGEKTLTCYLNAKNKGRHFLHNLHKQLFGHDHLSYFRKSQLRLRGDKL